MGNNVDNVKNNATKPGSAARGSEAQKTISDENLEKIEKARQQLKNYLTQSGLTILQQEQLFAKFSSELDAAALSSAPRMACVAPAAKVIWPAGLISIRRSAPAKEKARKRSL